MSEIRLGISACVLGQDVRFDGGHKLDRYVRETLGQFVTFVPVCPEVEAGMGIPREAVRLLRARGESKIRMVGSRTGTDRTPAMVKLCKKRVAELSEMELCGFILRKGSPSCGMERVKIYSDKPNTSPSVNGRGMFADALMAALPLLPVEEDGRLHDPPLRENFFERVFAYRRLKDLFRPRWKMGDLVAFHTREKLLLMAHNQVVYRELGRLVAGGKKLERADLVTKYEERFMAGLGTKANRGTHTNVLMHVAGYFKKNLDKADRDEIQEVIAAYQKKLVPLIVPITLLRHHVRRAGVEYLALQSYLAPHPAELMLRNHV